MATPASTTGDTVGRDGSGGEPASASWSDLYALTVEFEIGDAQFETFMALLRDNAARSMEAEPGCLRFDILVYDVPHDPRTVLLYEIYADLAAFDDHLSSDHYRRFDAETAVMVRRKAVRSYHLLEHAKSPSRT